MSKIDYEIDDFMRCVKKCKTYCNKKYGVLKCNW